ncbi:MULTISPECIES: DNA polymerase III subunit chi [unclassified Sphingomonas]|uniref:DNA polymerase III subunit chi n=1 Tax=unclassified Sphingomonas TaxID=196159 RepID=UPI00278189B3|nr:DNA polymerase III subunit chi [Sphingomonas sp. SORGH_AS_0879]MDQ1230672.1 DNA polymerase-3 subunit chi [Sphingomonas sp. SORGH_AS_0879]
MQVDFYHLTIAPLDRLLPVIAERVMAGGNRLLIVSADAGQRAALDRQLWTIPPDGFLPHAQAGEGDDAAQPVLIAPDTKATNGARHVALADGIWRDEALDFDRAFHFFDGDRIGEARTAWRTLADREGVERRYWKQNDQGRWEQAA